MIESIYTVTDSLDTVAGLHGTAAITATKFIHPIFTQASPLLSALDRDFPCFLQAKEVPCERCATGEQITIDTFQSGATVQLSGLAVMAHDLMGHDGVIGCRGFMCCRTSLVIAKFVSHLFWTDQIGFAKNL